MNKIKLKWAMGRSRIFRIGDSFCFAVQIPDDNVGISGSQCSNCGSSTAYSVQICQKCKLPFIGPFGFPQLPKWKALSPDKRQALVKEIYVQGSIRGRLKYTNVKAVPLTEVELEGVEALVYGDADLFLSTHKVDPGKIRDVLLT